MVSVASNVLATIGTILWCIQLLPQIYFNYKRKNCEGFPQLMMLTWALSAIPFSVYFIMQDSSIPLRVQPQLFGCFALITWSQVLYYPPIKLGIKNVVLCVICFLIIGLSIEIPSILCLRPSYRNGKKWPNLIFGIFASILLAVGLLPPYLELFKRNGKVIGMNFIFLFTDLMGAFFSFLSLIIDDPTSDIMGMVLYLVCMASEIGIFLSHIIWMIRFHKYSNDWIFGSYTEEEEIEKKKIQEIEELENGSGSDQIVSVKNSNNVSTKEVVAD